MVQYLKVKVEDIHVLLPALQVHEVTSLEGLITQGEAHVAWREEVLALLDLGQVLGRPCSSKRGFGVVFHCQDDAQVPVMLAVNEVLGLRTPQNRDWRALPPVSSRAQQLLDAVWVEPPNERHSYRLRYPVDLKHPG